MTAQHLARLERRRRLTTLLAFAIESEIALTDAAVHMVEKMVGGLFRRANQTRSERLIDSARALKETARAYARLGRVLIDARDTGNDPLARLARQNALAPRPRSRQTLLRRTHALGFHPCRGVRTAL